MRERMRRNEVPASSTWDLSDLYPNPEAWEQERIEILNLLDESPLWKKQGTLDAQALLAALTSFEALSLRVNHLTAYSRLRLSEDSSDAESQNMAGKIGEVTAKFQANSSDLKSKVLRMEDGSIEQAIQEEEALAPFRKYLRDMREAKPYRLSEESEFVLASLQEVLHLPYTFYQRSKLSDMTFSSVRDGEGAVRPVSFSLFENDYELNPDPVLRRAAYQSFTDTLEAYKHGIASAYAGEVQRQTVIARLRGYASATHMLLHSQQVGVDIYHRIIGTLFSELAPHMRRFVRLKQRILGLEKLSYCDLKVPFDDSSGTETISFKEAGQIIVEATRVMGPAYTELMKQGVSRRWIDYADNKGKSTGAFCNTPYGKHARILLTWAGHMSNAFLLAHELGHAGHFMLAARHQRFVNYRPSLFFIEAPSTLSELLLAEYLRYQSDSRETKRSVLMNQLNHTYYHNFVTHLLEAEMQRRVYAAADEGATLTAASLSAMKGSVLSEFWGDAVEIDAGARLTWMRQPHYYMGLYPYTYGAGLTVSTAMMAQIRDEGSDAVERWLRVLKAGGSMKPFELLRSAGIDFSDARPVHDAASFVGGLVDELEALS
ncbi:oligoendopeptidase F [Cohnella sp. JJ-181]|uniref:oligoendopeptidase F n=1 Tax=Cohnella rhizoplanae TaxID=2974897 RepID=UPI0022FF6DD1|nr:oligoendopeptidase F [Cohnella sp. JJ-181]CAI6077602.1 Oligoendopeptidase F, plasmid [Cohnella sp. JJ-181]